MKFLNILLKLRKRELREEKKKLSLLLKELHKLEEEKNSLLKALQETSKFDAEDINLLSFKNSYQHHLLRRIDNVEREIVALKGTIEKQKEKVALINSEIKLLEKRQKHLKKEAEKRADILLERFINEVPYRPELD
jgi:wobble nucleotide-excising tRNase